MKSTLSFGRFGFAVAICASLVLSVASSAFAQDAESPCPFLDDEIILYFSPSTAANVPAFQSAWNLPEAQEAHKAFFAKADAKITDKVSQEGEPLLSKYNYFKSLVCDYAGTDSFTRACVESYFKCVDGVILGFDIPEDCNDGAKALQQGLTLTYVFNENPNGIEPRKFFKDEEGVVTILKETDKEVVGKLLVKDGDDVKGEIFYGGTLVKDMDKCVVVLAGTQEGVEKKIGRFQNTNAFIAKRQGDQLLYVDDMLKEEFFKKLVEFAAKENKNNKEAQPVIEGLSKTKSFKFTANGTENGIRLVAVLETTDAETAQTVADLIVGGLAIVKSKADNADDLDENQKQALEIVKKIEVSHDKDALVTTCTLDVDGDVIAKIAKKICAEIQKNCK